MAAKSRPWGAASVQYSRDQRHRRDWIDDYGRLLEQPCPLPGTNVDRSRQGPCVRPHPAVSNDAHAVCGLPACSTSGHRWRTRGSCAIASSLARLRVSGSAPLGRRCSEGCRCNHPDGDCPTGDLGDSWFHASRENPAAARRGGRPRRPDGEEAARCRCSNWPSSFLYNRAPGPERWGRCSESAGSRLGEGGATAGGKPCCLCPPRRTLRV